MPIISCFFAITLSISVIKLFEPPTCRVSARSKLSLPLSQSGGNRGIHNLVVVNRLDNSSVSPTIKANIPARLIYKATSAGDSALAGVKGAENLSLGEAIYKSNLNGQRIIKTIYTSETNVKEAVEITK